MTRRRQTNFSVAAAGEAHFDGRRTVRRDRRYHQEAARFRRRPTNAAAGGDAVGMDAGMEGAADGIPRREEERPEFPSTKETRML